MLERDEASQLGHHLQFVFAPNLASTKAKCLQIVPLTHVRSTVKCIWGCAAWQLRVI
jgi:hypothetical protein